MRRTFGVVLVAAVVGVLASFGPALGFAPSAAPAPDEALVFIPTESCAVFDSRTSTLNPGPLPAGSVTKFTVAGSIPLGQIDPKPDCPIPPSGVAAVEINLVAISPAGGGNLKIAQAGATPGGGVVNYSATSGSNNSNALPVQVDSAGKVEVTVNASASHVRAVILGYWVPGNGLFLDKPTYDPEGDGSVAQADRATFDRLYCQMAADFPASYPLAPCRPVSRTLDGSSTDVGRFTSLAIGADSFPIISYYDQTNTALSVVHCTSADCSTAATPLTLDGASVDVGWDTSLAIGTDGYPIISYHDRDNKDLKVVHCTAIDCSTTDTPLRLDGLTTDVGRHTSLAIGTDGYPIISYFDDTADDLKVMHCTAIDCSTADAPLTLDAVPGHFVGTFTSLAIGTDGYPIISYHHSLFDTVLKLIHCTAVDCSTADTPVVLDDFGDVGWFTSLAIGTDGYPVISYIQAEQRELRLVHCTAVDCSTNESPLILDSTGTPLASRGAAATSVAIGTDGYPIISYHQDTSGELKVIRCTAVNCSTTDTPEIVDGGTNFVGSDSSLAIGTDGYPIISYRDTTNSALKVAKVAP